MKAASSASSCGWPNLFRSVLLVMASRAAWLSPRSRSLAGVKNGPGLIATATHQVWPSVFCHKKRNVEFSGNGHPPILDWEIRHTASELRPGRVLPIIIAILTIENSLYRFFLFAEVFVPIAIILNPRTDFSLLLRVYNGVDCSKYFDLTRFKPMLFLIENPHIHILYACLSPRSSHQSAYIMNISIWKERK